MKIKGKILLPYTHPSSGNFIMETNFQNSFTTDLKIYNLLGEQIISRRIEDKTAEIDLSSYPKGIYFIKVQNEKKFFIDKIIIE